MYELYATCYEILEGLPFHEFCSVLCVMLERKCKEDGKDIRDVAENIYKAIVDVNNKLGEM